MWGLLWKQASKQQRIKCEWRGECDGSRGARGGSLAAQEKPRERGSLEFHLLIRGFAWSRKQSGAREFPVQGPRSPSAGERLGLRPCAGAAAPLAPAWSFHRTAEPRCRPAAAPHRTASSRSHSGSPSSGRNPPAPRRACCECTEPGSSPLSGPGAAAAGSWLRSTSPESPSSPLWPSPAATHGAHLGLRYRQCRSPASAASACCGGLIFSKSFLFSEGLSLAACPHPGPSRPLLGKSREAPSGCSWQAPPRRAASCSGWRQAPAQMQIRFSFPRPRVAPARLPNDEFHVAEVKDAFPAVTHSWHCRRAGQEPLTVRADAVPGTDGSARTLATSVGRSPVVCSPSWVQMCVCG